MINRRNLPFIIPLLTFGLGIFTFSVFAILTNSFWFHSSVDIPLLKLPTLYIGDAILLPLFNYYLFQFYYETKGGINYKKYRNSFVVFTILAFVISFAINYFQHIAWTKDE